MLLTYERGGSDRPKGHALAYIRDAANPTDVYATYLIVPPIAFDLVKYMPPMFANKMSLADMQTISAVPLPPVPERVEGLDYLRALAERREDDLIFLGTANVQDVQSLLSTVADAAQSYLGECTTYAERNPVEQGRPAAIESADTSPEALSATVDDVVFSLMSDRDKLGELAKLVGKLRYAIDGKDQALAKDTTDEMEALARHLPERFHVAEIIAAARMTGAKGRTLAELHIDRCYKLSSEDFHAVEEIEGKIRQVERE